MAACDVVRVLGAGAEAAPTNYLALMCQAGWVRDLAAVAVRRLRMDV